jgi:hypothetical protein
MLSRRRVFWLVVLAIVGLLIHHRVSDDVVIEGAVLVGLLGLGLVSHLEHRAERRELARRGPKLPEGSSEVASEGTLDAAGAQGNLTSAETEPQPARPEAFS